MTHSKRILVLARSGDLNAQCRLASRLMSSDKPSGYERALPWLRRLARHADGWAEYHLGLIYDRGLGVRRNRGVATKWYERAAAGGYDSAQLNLGIILANLPGRRRDLDRAVQLYREAARQGNRNAAYNLGLYYFEGRGVRRDVRLARKWYELAAAKGDKDAAKVLLSLGRVPNPAIQRTVSRVTALAGKRKGRAARPHR